MNFDVSIVLPTKEEEGAFAVIKELKREFGSKAEIIVVDKSSEEYRKKIKKLGVVLVKQTTRGVENGLIEGFRHAHADILATVDADGTHALDGISKGMKLIKNGEVDLVLGNRMNNLVGGSMSAYLKFGNWGLSLMYNIFYGQHIHDILTGMQIMSRRAYEKVKNIRIYEMPIAFFQIEIARQGYKVGEVEIKYTERKFGESKLAKSKLMYGLTCGSQIMGRSPFLSGTSKS